MGHVTRCEFCDAVCSGNSAYNTEYRGPDKEVCPDCVEVRHVATIPYGSTASIRRPVDRSTRKDLEIRRLSDINYSGYTYIYIGDDPEKTDEVRSVLALLAGGSQ